MKIAYNVVMWILAVLFLILSFGTGSAVSTLLMLVAAVALVPLKPIQNLWGKILHTDTSGEKPAAYYRKKKAIKAAIIAAVFIAAVSASKTDGTNKTDSKAATASSQTVQSETVSGEQASSQDSGTAAASSSKPSQNSTASKKSDVKPASKPVTPQNIPAYSGKPYVAVNGNKPDFKAGEITAKSYEYYSPLDGKGRCGTAVASVGRDLMPTSERGSIGMVKPTGWHTVKYDCVDGKYLYNRCHLIGYQLSGENANEKNLITGTRYLNVDGMLPFENMVADYVKETGNHVMYRVTPVFKGNDLLASGVQMEALSVEDNGKGVCFNVYCYNVQPGVSINYATGDSTLSGKTSSASSAPKVASSKPQSTAPSAVVPAAQSGQYVLNTNTKKIHRSGCYSLNNTKEENKQTYNGNINDLLNQGYERCKNCNP